jgi:hypothetical protein
MPKIWLVLNLGAMINTMWRFMYIGKYFDTIKESNTNNKGHRDGK